MQRIPSGRACWPVGIYRFDYEEGQRCFSSLLHKESLVQRQDNGTSKWHVKLTRLCAIIQAFDLTNVFVPSSTSANTSTFPHPLFFFFFFFLPRLFSYCSRKNWLTQDLTQPMEKRRGENERAKGTLVRGGRKKKNRRRKNSSCWREMLGTQISLAVWLLLFELK